MFMRLAESEIFYKIKERKSIMKRVFALILAVAMVLSLGATALATEETGSITITNATINVTYEVYKIFDASVKFAKDAEGNDTDTVEGVAYSITQDNQFFDDLFGTDGTKDNTYFVYNPNTGSVTKRDGANDSELIKYLTDLVTSGTFATAAEPITATGDEVKFENLDYGYYMITSTLGTAVTINSNTPDVEVIDKNQEPGTDFDKQVWDDEKEEWVDANSANINDKISYQITFTATNYDGDKKIKYYQVHDEKGDAIWAEFNSIQVFVGNVELPRGYYLSQGGDRDNGTWEWLGDYDNSCSDGWDDMTERNREDAQWYLVHLGYDSFRITIPWLENHTLTDVVGTDGKVSSYSLGFAADADSKYDSPAQVVITYDAVVEPGAAIGSTTHGNRFNKANASWTSEHETGSTPPDEVVTNVYGIGLLKDDTATGQNLAGAKFRIYKDAACTQPVYVIPTDIKGVYIIDSLGTYAPSVTGSMMKDTRELYGAYLDEYLKDENGNTITQNNLVVSQINGKLIVLGLEAGTYYLKEVEAPAGYNALTVPVELKAGEGTRSFNIFVDENGNVANIQQADGVHLEKIYDLTHTVVHNSKGVELPSTGGEGAFMLITFGTMIAIGFAVLMITQKKMSIYRD